MNVVDDIFELFSRKGQLSYGENVTQLAHAVQCAHFAREDGATDSEVVAALLHDIGHLLDASELGAQDLGRDTHHEAESDQFSKILSMRHLGRRSIHF